jgi:hypothetical protein
MYHSHQKTIEFKSWLTGRIFKPPKTLLERFLVDGPTIAWFKVLMSRLKGV